MNAFENARKFFVACEAPEGWEGCKPFVAEGASFTAQSEPLTGINTIEAYCDWMAAIGTVTAPGATYDLHTSSYDEATKTAVFFATYHARHTGEGGPVPPTGKRIDSDYVYVMEFDGDRIKHMTKIWNDAVALKALGWAA